MINSKSFIILLLICLTTNTSLLARTKNIVANPINLNYRFQVDEPSRREAADPVLEYFNGKYYLFASKSGGYWSSPDLAEWMYIPCKTITTIEEYAPTILILGDTFYYIASGSPRIFSTQNPDMDEWKPVDTKFEYEMTDPAFFKDEDTGKVFMYWGCSDKNPIMGVEIDPFDGFKSIGKPVTLIEHNGDKYGWEVPGKNNEENRTGWNEGPCMIKHNGKYYLQYAAPGTEYRIYGDGIYTGDNPLGPFTYLESSPFSFKPGGFIGGAGHGHTFKDKYGNYWHVASMKISVRHMFERRLGLFPVYFSENGNMYAHTVWTDYPFYIPDKKIDFETNDCSMKWQLLSYNKPTSASSVLPEYDAKHANDEQIETWWAAQTGNAGEWWQVDLETAKEVKAIQVNFADQDFLNKASDSYVYYQYNIEISDDGKTWKQFIDRTQNIKDMPHELIILDEPTKTRYLRIVNTKHLDGKFSLSGFRVFGSGGNNLPQEISGIQVQRDNSDKRRILLNWNEQPNTTGYVVRWGIQKDELKNATMVFNNRLEGAFFNRDSPYYFSIDAFNENGITNGNISSQSKTYPFQNPDLSIDERVNDLVSRLTLEEKIGQMMNSAPAIDRLNIPAYDWWNECLHGVARAGKATVFPQAIGMAATFDADAMYRTAVVISDEARAKYNKAISENKHTKYHGLTFWTPNINIFRDPRWGRGQETYGEDPYLTGHLGLSFVKGLQGDNPKYFKTIATAKHYAVHSGPEYNRHSFDVHPPLRDVRETYLPAFEKLVREGNVQSVMCAYNRFEGSPCCGSDELLVDILRNQWGFQGYVVSDCGAIDNFYRSHKTSPDAETASAEAVIAGTDLECGRSYQALLEAVQKNNIEESRIDLAVKRLFTARMKLGMFDPADKIPYGKIPFSVVESAGSRKQSLEMARKSIVLLKNDKQLLPLGKEIKTIAVIGPNAANPTCLLANYNGSPSYIVTPLEGIRQKSGNKIKIIYDQGVGLTNDTVFTAIDISKSLKIDNKNGFKAEYFTNNNFSGTPALVQYEKSVDFFGSYQHQIAEKINADIISARWTSILIPVKNEDVCFEMTSDDSSFRLFIDDNEVMNRFSGQEARVEHYRFSAKAGKSYNIRFEFSQDCEGAGVSLSTVKQEKASPEALIKKIAPADVIVFVGGLSPSLEGEEMPVHVPGFNKGDRTSINLPEVQTNLLKQLAATGKPIVFVMLTGSALAISWEKENIPAIINAWYGGQDAGTALADVLFGHYNPAGRLPVTFYASDKDLPPYEDYSMKDRTYRYFTGKPLFEFGYGLSYTKFEYSGLIVPEKINANGHIAVKVNVKNTGSSDGEEVAQLYVSYPDAKISAPVCSLQGFQRVFLKAGESKQLEFLLTSQQLSVMDGLAQHHVIPDEILISVGGGQPGNEGIIQKAIRTSNLQKEASTGKPVRIGIDGLSHSHVHGLLGNLARTDIQIVGIAEKNKDLAQRYAKQYGFDMSIVYNTVEEMTEKTKPDGVCAFNSIYDHLHTVEVCAPQGIHVMVEKPLAVNAQHADKMAESARKHNIHLLTNYETTWYPSNHEAYKMAVTNHEIGDIRKVIVCDGHKGPKEIGCNQEFLDWLTDPILNGGGAVVDFGCYGANLMTWLMKNEMPVSVSAVLQQIKPDVYPKVDDEATIILTYPKAQAVIQASWNWPADRKDMEVYGATGYVKALNATDFSYRLAREKPETQEKLSPLAAPGNEPFAYFTHVIKGEIEVLPTDLSSLENNLIVVKILDAARESAKMLRK